jgi:hypothetical protein
MYDDILFLKTSIEEEHGSDGLSIFTYDIYIFTIEFMEDDSFEIKDKYIRGWKTSFYGVTRLIEYSTPIKEKKKIIIKDGKQLGYLDLETNVKTYFSNELNTQVKAMLFDVIDECDNTFEVVKLHDRTQYNDNH